MGRKKIHPHAGQTYLLPKAATMTNETQRPGTVGLTEELQKVWQAMHQGFCPNCGKVRLPELMDRDSVRGIRCPYCKFHVTDEEIHAIVEMNAYELSKTRAVFSQWRAARQRGVQTPETLAAMHHIPPVDFKDTVEKIIDDLQAKVARLELELAAKDVELQNAQEELSCDDSPDITAEQWEEMNEQLRAVLATANQIDNKRRSGCDGN